MNQPEKHDPIYELQLTLAKRLDWLSKLKFPQEVKDQIESVMVEIQRLELMRDADVEMLTQERNEAMEALGRMYLEVTRKDEQWQELYEEAITVTDERTRESIEDEIAKSLGMTTFEAGDVLELLTGEGDEMTPEQIERFKAWVLDVAKHNQAKRKKKNRWVG